MFATSLNSTLDLPCFIPPVCLLKPQLSCELTPQPEPTPVSPPSMSLLSRYRLRCKPRNLSCYHKPEPATTTSALHLSLLNTFLLNLSLVWLSTFGSSYRHLLNVTPRIGRMEMLTSIWLECRRKGQWSTRSIEIIFWGPCMSTTNLMPVWLTYLRPRLNNHGSPLLRNAMSQC